MDQLSLVVIFLAKGATAAAALWGAYAIGLSAGWKLATHDAAQVYTSLLSALVAWTLAVPMTIWLLGWPAFGCGAAFLLAALFVQKRRVAR